jgi:photosystem II stability/assembly factor-like uncharacterized protein
MTRMQRILLLLSLLIISGCTGQSPPVTPLPPAEMPAVTATASPTFVPTLPPTTTPTPTATVTPLSTPTSAPVAESSRQDDSSKGLDCSTWLGYVKMLDAKEGWIVGADGVVLYYTVAPGNDTPTWQQIPPSEAVTFSSLSMVSSTEGWAIGGIIGGGILHYKRGIWQGVEAKDPPHRGSLFDLDMLNEEEGWVVGEQGIILHYTDGEWQPVPSPTTERLLAVDMVSAEEGWAAGVGSAILHYQNQQWEEIPLATIPWAVLNDIEMVIPEEGWIVGDFAMLHYQNGQWQEVLIPWALKDVSMVSAEEGWAVGEQGRILHCRQGEWQEVTSPTENTLLSLDMVNAEEGWAVGSKCTILHYQNGEWELVHEAE